MASWLVHDRVVLSSALYTAHHVALFAPVAALVDRPKLAKHALLVLDLVVANQSRAPPQVLDQSRPYPSPPLLPVNIECAAGPL